MSSESTRLTRRSTLKDVALGTLAGLGRRKSFGDTSNAAAIATGPVSHSDVARHVHDD